MLKITRDHPIFLSKNKVQQLCEDFFKQHGFNYFQYIRCYHNGAFSLLTNKTEAFEYFAKLEHSPVVFSSYMDEHEDLHSYWFFWDEELPSGPVQLVREISNIHHGLTLVRRAKNYYDMIAVGLPEQRMNAASFYLTKLKAIEYFINSFDKKNQDLISQINRHAIVLPDSYRDINYQKICLHNRKIAVQGVRGLIHITAQELACVRLLVQGATYKQIAKILQLSPRTVETYINRIKQRSGITLRTDFAELIAICP